MPFCSQCGDRLSPNANFCPNCGVSLAQVPPTASLVANRVVRKESYDSFETSTPTDSNPEPSPYQDYTNMDKPKPPEAVVAANMPKITPQRSAANIAGSAIFFVIGISGVCASIFLLLLSTSILAGAVSLSFVKGVPFVGGIISGSVVAISLELLVLLLASFHFVAGNWLWQSLKRGGILGVTIIGFNIVISILAILYFPSLEIIGYAVVIVSVFMLLMAIAGWSALHASSPLTET
jgi:hypothetical protein